MKAICCDIMVSRAQKVLSVVLAVFVATVAIVPLSVSAGPISGNPNPVVSPIVEPFGSQTLISGVYTTKVYMPMYLDLVTSFNTHYALYFYTCTSSEPLTLNFAGGTIHGNVEFQVTNLTIYDIITGNVISSGAVTVFRSNALSGYPWQFSVGPINQGIPYASYSCNSPNLICTGAWGAHFFDPFVTWAVDAPEQIQYKSSLPSPQWDIHNRYIVIDDKLFWLSFYIDNLWINPITGSATVSSDDHTAVVTGNASDPTDGDIYYNYNVSIRYQDKDYYCLQYNSVNYSNETMCAPCLVYNSSGSRLTISFDQLSGLYSSIADILVDYRIYCSSFDLVTGEYIESVYAANGQQGNAEININIGCPDEISSVYCYGIDFVNPQNLPVNLSSVIWSYDLEFAQWRSDVYSKLNAIYILLAQSEVPSTTQYQDFASMIHDNPTIGDFDAEDAGQILGEAASNVNVNFGDGMEWGRNEINSYLTNIPELFIVIILALSFGLAIMVLGKKKSDN